VETVEKIYRVITLDVYEMRLEHDKESDKLKGLMKIFGLHKPFKFPCGGCGKPIEDISLEILTNHKIFQLCSRCGFKKLTDHNWKITKLKKKVKHKQQAIQEKIVENEI